MVSKEVLSQYGDLLKEKEMVAKRINSLEKQIEKIVEEGSVKDSVKGGLGGTQHFVIEGFPNGEYALKERYLNERKSKLRNLERKIESALSDIDDFVSTIDDSRMRIIISLRFIDGLSWNQVADAIGGGNTEDSVRMAFNRFIETESCSISSEKI